jgi:phage-related protein
MNLFDLAAKITLDSSEYEAGVKNINRGVPRLSSAIKTGLGVAAKATAAAVGAAAAGLATIVKSSVDAYGEYEQLVGGINKLFGEGSQQLQEYASQAYMTSGMSANQYMQNVTGFSAALINSLDGDTVRAAEIADMAMRDISDNANTYGKYSAEELASVYQALAKGQYQTLDNLNLGFGGTKEGMQSLIDKANELRAAQGLNADLTIDSYADIVQAIHEVQTEMGITGTTANEASGTIQGSLAATKAAWQNLLIAFGSGKDVKKAMSNLLNNAKNVVKNVMPVVKQALTGIAEFVGEIAPIIVDELPGLIQELLPGLLSAATSLVGALIQSMPNILSALWSTVKSLFGTLDATLSESSFGERWSSIKEAVGGAVDGIRDAWERLTEKAQPLIDKVTAAWDAFKQFEAEHHLIEAAISAIGSVIEIVVLALGDVVSAIDSVLSGIKALAESGAWQKFSSAGRSAAEAVVAAFFPLSGLIGKIGGQLADVGSNGHGGHFAIGNDYIPYNNYPAVLHRGEAVLTAREADEWRRGMGGGGRMIQITQNIQTVPMTPVEVAETTAAYFEMARWAV